MCVCEAVEAPPLALNPAAPADPVVADPPSLASAVALMVPYDPMVAASPSVNSYVASGFPVPVEASP